MSIFCNAYFLRINLAASSISVCQFVCLSVGRLVCEYEYRPFTKIWTEDCGQIPFVYSKVSKCIHEFRSVPVSGVAICIMAGCGLVCAGVWRGVWVWNDVHVVQCGFGWCCGVLWECRCIIMMVLVCGVMSIKYNMQGVYYRVMRSIGMQRGCVGEVWWWRSVVVSRATFMWDKCWRNFVSFL